MCVCLVSIAEDVLGFQYILYIIFINKIFIVFILLSRIGPEKERHDTHTLPYVYD